MSLSARRAWIEIARPPGGADHKYVALRKESVDRNCSRCHSRLPSIPVALRKESVDRNITNELLTALKTVALRKESVDRNDAVCANNHKRRVALRKESVDRN